MHQPERARGAQMAGSALFLCEMHVGLWTEWRPILAGVGGTTLSTQGPSKTARRENWVHSTCLADGPVTFVFCSPCSWVSAPQTRVGPAPSASQVFKPHPPRTPACRLCVLGLLGHCSPCNKPRPGDTRTPGWLSLWKP